MRALLAILIVALPASAAADDEGRASPLVKDAEKDVADGNLLFGVVGARHDRQEVLVSASAGRDTSTGTTVLGSAIDATLVDRLALRATFANDGYDPNMRPSVGLSFDVLRQGSAPIDLAIGAAYATQDFNQVGGILVHAAVARRVGATTLVGNVEYGAGLSQGERYGAVGFGAIRPVAGKLYAGVSSIAHLDLELDDVEPAEERTWDVQGGPVASYAFGPLVVSASAGVAAWQFRLHPDSHVGAIGLVGGAMTF